jgi:hypothetical protein
MVSGGLVQMPSQKNDQRSSSNRREEDGRRDSDLGKIALYGLGGGLAPLILILFLNHFLEPVRRVRSEGSRTLDYKIEKVVKAKAKAKPKAKEKTGIQSLREDLLNLAPDLYHGVKLESLISKSDPTAVDSTVTVDAIEFQVKAKRWDEMAGDDKVTVLNRTFDFLKNTFPSLP